eukprot:3166813-Rhodomonas_salina.1
MASRSVLRREVAAVLASMGANQLPMQEMLFALRQAFLPWSTLARDWISRVVIRFLAPAAPALFPSSVVGQR